MSRVNFRPLFLAAVLVAPGLLFSQAPQTMSSPPAQAGAKPAKETGKRDGKTPSSVDVDSAATAALRTAFAAQRTKGSYRALLDTSLGGNVLPSLEVEAVYPDRIRLKRSGLEIIFVAGKGMLRRGDNWTPAPATLAKSLGAIDDPQEDEKLLGNAVYAKSLGQTKMDDRLVAGYEIHRKGKNGLTKSKFFISMDDSLIRRIETRAEIQGRPLISTSRVGDYGIPIQIELPK